MDDALADWHARPLPSVDALEADPVLRRSMERHAAVLAAVAAVAAMLQALASWKARLPSPPAASG